MLAVHAAITAVWLGRNTFRMSEIANAHIGVLIAITLWISNFE